MIRPPAHLVHGLDGPVVILSARVCAYLNRRAGLDRFRTENRGADAEVDAALVAVRLAGLKWQESATGTKLADLPELAAESEHEWFSTTQAGDLMGVSDRAIRKAIDEGRLRATKVGRANRIHRIDLEHFRADRVGRRA